MNHQFQHRGFVTITHLNTRKEGPDEDKILAVDLKLEAECPIDVTRYFDDALADFLFMDEMGTVRNEQLEPVKYKHELEHYRLEIAGSAHYGCKVKKFALTPRDGGIVTVAFQVSFQPSGDEVARIAEYLQDEIGVVIEPSDAELFDEPQRFEAEEAVA